MKLQALLSALLLSTVTSGAAAQVHEAPPRLEPYVPRRAPEPLPEPMSAALPETFVPGWNVHDLGALRTAERARAAATDAAPVGARLRVGLVRPAGPAPLRLDGAGAVRTELGGGLALWTLAVRSPGSRGLRLRLVDFEPPGGDAALLVYGREADGRVVARGPYRWRAPGGGTSFWTGYVPGEVAWVEFLGPEAPTTAVAAVAHFDRHPGGRPGGQALEGGAAGVDPCHQDAACSVGTAEKLAASLATGQMNYVSDGDVYVCTGTLLTDLDPEADGPYFLTADHCIGEQAEASTLEVVWFWAVSYTHLTLPTIYSV